MRLAVPNEQTKAHLYAALYAHAQAMGNPTAMKPVNEIFSGDTASTALLQSGDAGRDSSENRLNISGSGSGTGGRTSRDPSAASGSTHMATEESEVALQMLMYHALI